VTEVACGKRKKLAVKKRKRTPTEAEIAQVVADAAERVERGGRGSGIHIGERRFHLDDRQLGTEDTEGTEDPPAEQPTEAHLQSSPQRRQRSRSLRLHRVVAQDVRVLR
jgi:hypothetical protein